MNTIFCFLLNGPFNSLHNLTTFIKLEIILLCAPSLCFLLFLFLSFWKMDYLSPALTPTQTQKEYHLSILFHPCVLQKISIKGPPETPRADFISWAAFMIYTEISPPILSPAVIPEQDVAHKSFPSAYLPPTDQLIFTRVAISHTPLV